MPEYIEREALMKSVNELKKSPWYNNKSGLGIGRRDGVGVVADLCIKQAPTVDVVEVVRCEECRNLVVTETNTGFAYRCRRNGLKERDIHPKFFAVMAKNIQKKENKMTSQEVIKQLNILLSRERYLLGCSSDEHRRSQMIEALEIAKQAVEESEVKHGKWIMRGGWFRCSECDEKAELRDVGGTGGFSHEYEQIKSNYCSNCGAKMDGKESE